MAQDTLTGAFQGTVTQSATGTAIIGAQVVITNIRTRVSYTQVTDARGRFYQGRLAPDDYSFQISYRGYQSIEFERELRISEPNEVIPIPVTLDLAGAATTSPPPPPPSTVAVRAAINTTDGRRRGSFVDNVIVRLPLGAATFVRTFDELATLLPGVAPAPQTLGSVAGPGVGAGVGTAGQFSVNGLRSRANNFTVDGSDNNDEDIGVRRQGFVALIPQTIESIKEYQAITLLAPAQYGRNLGAQVNAVSRAGGNDIHGSLYGFFNSSQLNARNYFDTVDGNGRRLLFAGNNQRVLRDEEQITIQNQSGAEDSFTFSKFGGVIGGPVRRDRTFYFFSAEGQIINATKEESFAVPTVDERGAFGTGATGIFNDPFTGLSTNTRPLTGNSNLIYSLIPFPNHPEGIYGANTLTKTLPANARGGVYSAKFDENIKISGRPQTITGRYNFTDDRREIPTTGEALFSSLQPEVRAQNFSFFFNSQLSAAGDVRRLSNQFRFSYGRTRLRFEEVRDRDNDLLPSRLYPGEKFLLNAKLFFNCTTPVSDGVANRGDIIYRRNCVNPQAPQQEVETFGSLGQINIAGFSPIGVDVYNFPQKRVNNTYQLADQLNWQAGDQTIAFGADLRRSELNSELPRINRPLVTYQGGPRFIVDEQGRVRLPNAGDKNPLLQPLDLVALGAPNSFFLTLLSTPTDDPRATGAEISLRYHQLNFFLHDEWRLLPNLSLTFGLRYEYNTPPKELNERIERTFTDQALARVPGFGVFLENRRRIFDPDRNNFAPRLGLAYTLDFFGRNRLTVFRAGYGIFYDQILGAVVSQSRNVFPTFLTLNFGGLRAMNNDATLTFLNPALTNVRGTPIIRDGTLNHLNLNLNSFLQFLLGDGGTPPFPDALGLTLPRRTLATPMAHHYSFAVEQQFNANISISISYVGTLGRHLLRFTTPNNGPGAVVATKEFIAGADGSPRVSGRILPPSRSVSGVGAVSLFETTAGSRYDSLQVQARSRFGKTLQWNAAYTFSHADDDVSDVFDLAGSFVLPQNSRTFAGERGPANFDVRHRFATYFVSDLSMLAEHAKGWNWLLSGLQAAAIGRFQTGQPFTVNSIFDVNLDGNLTDRLNTTSGLIMTGDRRQPLRLDPSVKPVSLLAPFGSDGEVKRNSFRASGLIELDLMLSKQFRLTASQHIDLRTEFFNILNRANFGVPVRLLEAPAFGQAPRTVTPGLRIQFGLKYVF